MAWSAVNKVLDLFRERNEDGIAISDEVNDAGNQSVQEHTTNENVSSTKNTEGGDLAEVADEVDSDIASQSDSTDRLDESDESVTIAADDSAKAGNSVSGSQPIYVERISSVFSIRSTPNSPLQRRKLFTRTKSEDAGASFSSSTSSDLNKSEPLSSSVGQILEANFPFRRDRLLDLLKSVKKNEEVENQKVEKEYDEGKRIEYKVERFVSRSKANISAQLLSDDSDVTTVLSDESYETCECDLEPNSSEAESVGGDSEPTEEQEELQDARLDRFLENLSYTSEQNQFEEDLYGNNSSVDFVIETENCVDGTAADEKRNDSIASPMMVILDGNNRNRQKDSEDVKKDCCDSEGGIVSEQHRLKVKPDTSEINNADKVFKFEEQRALKYNQTKPQCEQQREVEECNYAELDLEKCNSGFHVRGEPTRAFGDDHTKRDGGNHHQPDHQKIMVGQHVVEKEPKEVLFIVEKSKHDKVINEEDKNRFKEVSSLTEIDNQVSTPMNQNIESEHKFDMEKLCCIMEEVNIENNPALQDNNFTCDDVKNKITTSHQEHSNPEDLERDKLDQDKAYLLKGSNEYCQLEEHEIKVNEFDILKMEANKVVPVDQNQTSQHINDVPNVISLIEQGNEGHAMKEREQFTNKIGKFEPELDFVITSKPSNDRKECARKILEPVECGGSNIKSEQKITEFQKQNEKLIKHDCEAIVVDLSEDFTLNERDQMKYEQEILEIIKKQPEIKDFDRIECSTINVPEKFDFDVSCAIIDRPGTVVTNVQSEMFAGNKFEMKKTNIESENVESNVIVGEKIATSKKYDEECTIDLQVSSECNDKLSHSRKGDKLSDLRLQSTNEENLCLIGKLSNAERVEAPNDLGAKIIDERSSSNDYIQNLNIAQNDNGRDICDAFSETDFPAKLAPPKIAKLVPIEVNVFEDIVPESGQTEMYLKADYPERSQESMGSKRIREGGLEFMSNTELHISERKDSGLDISSREEIETSKDIKKITSKDGETITEISEINCEQNLISVETELKRQDVSLTSSEHEENVVESDKVVKDCDYGPEKNYEIIQDGVPGMKASDEITIDAVSSLKVSVGIKNVGLSSPKMQEVKKLESMAGIESSHNSIRCTTVKGLECYETRVKLDENNTLNSPGQGINDGGTGDFNVSANAIREDNIGAPGLKSETDRIQKNGVAVLKASADGNLHDSAAVPDSSACEDVKHDDVMSCTAAADGIKKDGVAGLKASPDATLMETLSHAIDAAAFEVSEAPHQRPDDDGGSDTFQHCQPPKRTKKNVVAVSAVSSFDLSHYRKYVRESSRKALDTRKDITIRILEERENDFDLNDKENIERIHTDLQTGTAEDFSELRVGRLEDLSKSHDNISEYGPKTTRLRSSINDKIALFNKEREKIIADSSRSGGHCHSKGCNKTNESVEDLIANGKFATTDNTSLSDDSETTLIITDKDNSASFERITQTDQIKHTKKVSTKDKNPTTSKRISKKVQRSVTRVLSQKNEKKPGEQFVDPTNYVTSVLSPQKEEKPEEQFVDPAICIHSSVSVQARLPGRVYSTIASTPSSTSHPSELMKEGKVSGQKESKRPSEVKLPTSDEVDALAPQTASHCPSPVRQSVHVFRSLQNAWQDLSTSASPHRNRSTENMAAADAAPLLSSKKVVWPRKIDHSDVIKAIPPWAEPGAQPPPPPLTHYSPFSPPSARRQFCADDSGPKHDLTPSKQSKMSKSKSESQLNNYGTLFSLKNTASSAAHFKSPQRSGLNKSERSLFKLGHRNPSQTTESAVSQTDGSRRAADNANDITSAYVAAAAAGANNNAALKEDLQITGGRGVTGASGQGARTSRVGDITSVAAQSTTPPATDQAQPRQQLSTNNMVTVRTGSEGKMGPGGALPGVGGEQVAPTPGSGGKTVTAGKFGPSISKGTPSAGVKVSGVSVGVDGGAGIVVAKNIPWRKGEASAKAAHMPASPRLETRKNVSLSQSSQPVVAPPPVIKEQQEELPDAPWRKSPQQPRKTAAPARQKPTSAVPSAAVTVATTTAPAAAPATVAAPSAETASTVPSTGVYATPTALVSSQTTTSEQSVEEEITKSVRETSVKSSVSVKQESSSFSSSLVSESGQKDAFVATSTVSSSSSSSSIMPSATILSQTGINPANLPPHVPPQHKKISGSPRGSPKGSPILPRRGAQSTPPPAPSASTKPAAPPVAPSETIGTAPPAAVAPVEPSVPAVNNVPAVASSSSVSSTFVSVAESSTSSVTSSVSRAAFSATSVLSEQSSSPIVLRNTVVPLPDESVKEKVKIVKKENESEVKEPLPPPFLAPDPAPATKAVPSNESATNFFDTKSTIESSNENKAAIKSVFAAESAQLESLSSSQLETSFSPPPPPSLPEPPPSEQDPALPPLPPPPPATFITEDPRAVSSVPFNILPLEREKEDYVPLPVTSRIRSFEKQSSMDDYREEKPAPQQIRPVGPWVKKTSAGPVAAQELWELSPEGETWPRPPPPPPHPHSEAPSSPPSSHRPPHPHSPYQIPQKPHTYQPQVYQSPAQLEKMQKQQLRTVPAPPPHHQYQQQQQQQQEQQQQQQKPQHRAPQQPVAPFEQQIVPPRAARTRTGSTSEQLNLIYSLAQNGQGTGSAIGGDMPGPSAALTKIPTALPGQKDPYFDPWCDPENPRVIQFQDVSAAAFKIKSGIMNTPCTRSHMSALTGVEIFFKKEFNQYTGSFKERGARYTLLSLTEEQRQAGVIAASAGNHALALSYHGQDLGIPVTVVMPLVAPIMKVQACRQYGANILVRGADIAECRMIALEMAKEQGLLYINGYDHPHILAGQGTMGLEIVEQVPNIDAVVIPVGGGGLIAGVALAVKALYPHIQVIGVESEKCASFTAALANGRPTYTKAESTLADGLAVPTVGVNAFATASTLVDKVVTVREEWIAIAILRLVELEKAVVEGAGATALAAILAGELPELKGKRVVIPLCGGNIDTTVLGRCLERGLAADGRLVKFTVTVSDRPGGIAELTRLMASMGVSIKDMTHERAWIRSDIFSVEVKVLCETRDFEHFLELKVALEDRYKIIRFAMPDQIHAETDF